MSVEGSLVRPESATGPCEKEQGYNSETENIPEWSLNKQTYELLQGGHCTYNAEEQSLVWPPMLLMCSFADSPSEDLERNINWLRDKLSVKGVQANSVAQTKHVCCEGNRSYHLFALSPSGLSFAAAKAVDSAHGFDLALRFDLAHRFDCDIFYPSLKDMIDIKNGRVPEFSRRLVEDLKYHGMPKQAWINLAVDLVREDGICVGRGVCQKYEAMDSVNEELLGELHVGVQVLEVLDNLLPSHWKGSLRRWRTTHVLHNGVSLFECLRQHVQDKSKELYYMNGSNPPPFVQAEGVLRDQSISSVAPSVGTCKDLNVNFDHLPSTFSKTCRDAIDAIEKSAFKNDSAAPTLYDGESFATKYEIDESLRKDDIQMIINDTCEERNLMEVLGTSNSFHLARDVVKRLTVLQELINPRCSSTTITSMIGGAEQREVSTLDSIGENIRREKRNKIAIAGFNSEIERLILKRRKQQHRNLLEEVENIKAKHVSTLEAFVLDKFKFVDDIGKRRKETEGILEWLSHYTAKAEDKEKKKCGEQVAEARLEEKKKCEEEVAKARDEEKRRCEEQVAEARLEEQKKWEEEVAKARLEEQKNWEEQLANIFVEEFEKLAEVRTELEDARQELSDQEKAIPTCAICLERLEESRGTSAKCGQKRSRNDVVLKKRACFTPCMHSGMCLDCAVLTWKEFKKCPVCTTPCSSEPQRIFM